MSSKSRTGGEPASQTTPAPAPADEVIHAPKGTNPLKFVLMVGLLIFLLIIFVAPQAIMSAVSPSGSGGDEVLSFTLPGGNDHAVTRADFVQGHKRAFNDVFEVFSGGNETITNEQVAGLILFDELARQEGVAFTDEDLREFLTSVLEASGATVADYEAMLRQRRRVSAADFERAFARWGRVRRYLDLNSFLGGYPTADAVVEAWTKQHVESSFEYAVLELEGIREELRAAPLTDEELQAWLDGLADNDPRAMGFNRPARTSAAQARLGLEDGSDVSALLERYPAPEGTDPEAAARAYHATNSGARFARDPLGAEATEEEQAAWTPYMTFEEARDRALREAAIEAALIEFAADFTARSEAGEEPDLGAEAAALGLAFEAGGVPRTHAEWRSLEEWGGNYVAITMVRGEAGQLSAKPLVESGAMIMILVQEQLPPGRWTVAENREVIEEGWVNQRAEALAFERLEEVLDGMRGEAALDEEEGEETAPDETLDIDPAVFRAAVENAGMTVVESPWLDAMNRDLQIPADGEDPLVSFIRFKRGLYELEPGEVAAPALDTSREKVWLIRCAGKRPVPVDDMTPYDLDATRQFATGSANRDHLARALGVVTGGGPVTPPTFDLDVLAERFDLVLGFESEPGD
jgi:hypothetical protein